MNEVIKIGLNSIALVLLVSLATISGISVISVDDGILIENAFAQTTGDIASAITETLTLSTTDGDADVFIMPVTGDIYAVGYGRATNAGVTLTTFSIDSTGDISAVQIDSENVAGAGEAHTWVKVDDTTFATFYRGPSNFGLAKTLTVDGAGNISPGVADSSIWLNKTVNRVESVAIDSDTFAIIFQGPSNTGNVTTVDIDASGDITNGNEFFVFNSVTTNGFSVAEIHPNIVGILSNDGTNNQLDFITMDVSDTGVIGNAVADRFDGVLGSNSFPHGPPVKVDSTTTIILPYADGTGSGIKTVEVSAAGAITEPVLDTQILDAGGLQAGSPFKVANNVYGIAYSGASNDLYISTIGISDAGSIDDTSIDNFEFRDATNACSRPYVLEVSTGEFAISYDCSVDITTISIETVTVVASSSSTGSSDNSAPSLGSVGSNGFNSIDSGFSYNQKPTDVTGWKTDFPLARTPTGELNTLDLKVKENKGLTNVYFVSVHFGVPKAGAQGEAIVTYYPNKKDPIKIDDPNNLLGEVDFKVNPVKCKANSTTESCFNFSLDHSFNDAPIHEMVGITVADLSRNVAYAYFNHGVEVYGDSLNPPVTKIITNTYEKNTPQITLTQTDRELDLWIDENENQWTRNNMDSWFKITQEDYTHPDDDIMGETGYKRIHDHFATYLSGQELIATEIWDSSEIQSDIPNVIKSKTFNENESLIQNEIQKEIIKAQTVWNAELIQKSILDSTETKPFKKISRENDIELQQNIKYEMENAESFMIKFQIDDSVNLIEETNNVQQNFAENYIPYGKIIEDSTYIDDIRWAEFEKAKQMLDKQYDPTRFFKYR